MELIIDHLALGFSTALTWQNLLYALTGCLIGTLIGVLPGLGPVATIAMLLPLTYGLEPTGALIMLSSIYYGAQYGGSTTAILVNLPGDASSAVLLPDGHGMAKQGRAGPALAASAIGSFFAGCVGVVLIAAFAMPLSELALRFGPAEYFTLMLLGLVGSVALSSDGLAKSMGMVVFGLLLGIVGTDVNSGVQRYTWGQLDLADGLQFACVTMGIFGIAEIARNLGERRETGYDFIARINGLMPSRTDLKRMTPSILRGTALGSVLGILPGIGASIAAFSGYVLEKRTSRYRDEIGHGAIEGIAGPEAANNAAAQTNFIPLLTMGIPGSAVMALLIGAMVIHDIQPGPEVMTSHPALFWGLIASMWIGNLMLLVFNLPLVGMWVMLLKVPYKFLYPSILVVCAIGIYSIRHSTFDIYQMAAFSLLGYFFIKVGVTAIPLLLGFVLGPLLEENLRRTLLISRGDFSVFLSRPVACGLLIVTLLLIVWACLPALKRARWMHKESLP